MSVSMKLLAVAGMLVVAACAPEASEQPAQTAQIGIERGATPVGFRSSGWMEAVVPWTCRSRSAGSRYCSNSGRRGVRTVRRSIRKC